MTNRAIKASAVMALCSAALMTPPALAAVSEAQAAALGGPKLTPVGAERAGSQDGVIPAWSRKLPELLAAVSDMESGDFYPDLFKAEEPVLQINQQNYKQYADHLTAGQIAMLKRFEGYYLNVYPTHRTALYPDAVYAATQKNATTATLDGVDNLNGAHAGFPFPIPETGAQVIWNHKVRYRGNTVQQTGSIITVEPDGEYRASGYEQTVKFFYGNTKDEDARQSAIILKLVRHVVSPPREAGRYVLVIDRLNGRRDAWLYTPGLRRILQAPTIAFDTPISNSEGLIAADQSDMFNGAMHQYNWKLLGKKTVYIPYNPYALQRPDLTLDELIQPGHLNPAYQRYELHRVWVVEATLKRGADNLIYRRTFYVDEDSWTIAAVDCYDKRGQIWRYQEGHIMPLIGNDVVFPAPMVVYSLNSGAYAIQNLATNAPYFAKFGVSVPPAFFTPQYMKRTAY